MVMVFVHPDHDCRAVSVNFTQQLRSSSWVITDTQISFQSFGDLVSSLCRLIITVHLNTDKNCGPLEIRTPPQLPSWPITWYIWAPLNKPKHAVLYSNDDKSFNNHAVNDNGLQPLRASIPSDAQHTAGASGMRVNYYLHCHNNNPANLVGSAVISVDGICLLFNPIANTIVFGHYFSIEYKYDGSTYVRAISPFKFVSCFCLTNKLTYTLSHPSNAFCLDAAIPTLTLARIFEIILDRCIESAAATSIFLSQINMLPLWHASKHSSMAPLVSTCHRRINGPKFIWTMPKQLPSLGLFKTRAQS